MTKKESLSIGYRPVGYRRTYLFRPGDAVRVKGGALANATGVIERITPCHRYVVAIDGVNHGISVVVSATSLEMVDSLSC